MSGGSEITRVLDAAARGDPHAAGELLPLVYEELRKLARSGWRAKSGQTLQGTALVHEAYLRLVGGEGTGQQYFSGRGHFFAAAAEAMRRILVDAARRNSAPSTGVAACARAVIGLMMGLLALHLKMRVKHGGSTTLKRLTKRKGLEADQCYWVGNEPAVRTKKRIDLRVDPPPDLVIEIDVMHSVVDRDKIYAALGVPEMWVLGRGAKLAAFALDQGAWTSTEHSRSFPFLRVADLDPFVARIGVDDDTSVLPDFSEWLRATGSSTPRR